MILRHKDRPGSFYLSIYFIPHPLQLHEAPLNLYMCLCRALSVTTCKFKIWYRKPGQQPHSDPGSSLNQSKQDPDKPPDTSVKSQQHLKCKLTLLLPYALVLLKAIILLEEWTWCPWLCSSDGWKQLSSKMYQKVSDLNFHRKKNNHVNHLILKRKEVKFHIYESSHLAWKFTDQWNLTLQVQGADYTPDPISSLLHGNLLHTDLPLDFHPPGPSVVKPSLRTLQNAESRNRNRPRGCKR